MRNVNLFRLYDYMLCLFTHTHTLIYAVHLPCQHPHSVIKSFPILLFNYKHPAYWSHNIFALARKEGRWQWFDVKRKKRRKEREKLYGLLWPTSLSSPGTEARERYLHTLWKKGRGRLTSITPDLSTASGEKRGEGRPLTRNPHP